jgi:ribosome modulation factor
MKLSKYILGAIFVFVVGLAIARAEHMTASDVVKMHEMYGGLVILPPEDALDGNTVDVYRPDCDLPDPEIPVSTQRRIYTQGVFAGFYDASPDDCPYEVENWRVLWFDGWQDGQNFYRDLIGPRKY